MKANYSPNSPYAATKVNGWYLGHYVHRPIYSAPDDELITLEKKYENRPDKLSYDLYGTPEYWWVFQTRNRNVIKHPIWGMTAGIMFYAPSLNHITKSLGQ